MSAGLNVFLAGAAVIIMCVTATAAAKRQAASWNYYHFDGRGFVAGKPADNSSFVAVRDGVRPVVLMQTAKIEPVALPSGKGAIAGICYIQSSGGKLAGGPGYAPLSHAPVMISAGETSVTTVQSDEQGYFVAVLAPGKYRVGTAPFYVEITVEKYTTKLVPLRAGKRMVD